jgi:hypothetical protein
MEEEEEEEIIITSTDLFFTLIFFSFLIKQVIPILSETFRPRLKPQL